MQREGVGGGNITVLYNITVVQYVVDDICVRVCVKDREQTLLRMAGSSLCFEGSGQDRSLRDEYVSEKSPNVT